MKYEVNQVEGQDEEVVDLPASAASSVARKNRYGSVPGLEDEELADPDELERQVMLDEWGPVLQLPVGKRNAWVRPSIDESGHVDWGAFGTVDFERGRAPFNRRLYKVERLREELRDVLILFSVVQRRLPEAKYAVLQYLRMGIVELEHIFNDDMRALGRLWLRAERIRQQIRELREAGRQRVMRRVTAVL